MKAAATSPYLVPYDGRVDLAAYPTRVDDTPPKKECKARLEELGERLDDLQRRLYAQDRWSVLTIFQALDAAGKDGTIRAVLRNVDPAGISVQSFKQPSAEELDHDFLWRTARRLPERGRIGVFNRSYYEEVLVVRVHPEILDSQRLPDRPHLEELWEERLESIRDHERHLARNGTLILKFFLNISREEQRQRFLSRLDEPEKHWKFATGDVEERRHWEAYQRAYQSALAATSRPGAPWYVIPADDKPYMRLVVADLLVRSLESLDLRYPTVGDEERQRHLVMRAELEDDADC